jgi:hypothetical protein
VDLYTTSVQSNNVFNTVGPIYKKAWWVLFALEIYNLVNLSTMRKDITMSVENYLFHTIQLKLVPKHQLSMEQQKNAWIFPILDALMHSRVL